MTLPHKRDAELALTKGTQILIAWRLVLSVFFMTIGGEAMACDPIDAAQLNAIGQSQMEVVAKIKAGQCALVWNFHELRKQEEALVARVRSPTCKVRSFHMPHDMRSDVRVAPGRPPHLLRISDYCGGAAKPARATKGARVCSKFSVTESEGVNNHCLIFNKNCGFTVSANLGKSINPGFKGSVTVGATPVTQCSGFAEWKYVFRGTTDQHRD